MPTELRNRRADAFLLVDPAWVEVYETIKPRCIPVKIPSSRLETSIVARTRASTIGEGWRLAIPQRSIVPGSLVGAVLRRLPPQVEVTDPLEESDVCWWPDTLRCGWENQTSRAFELGVPCVTTSRTSAAKILFGSSGSLEDRRVEASVAGHIEAATEQGMAETLRRGLPLFRRCLSAFYWLNSFMAHATRAPLSGNSICQGMFGE
jgi:hypothetical protein